MVQEEQCKMPDMALNKTQLLFCLSPFQGNTKTSWELRQLDLDIHTTWEFQP